MHIPRHAEANVVCADVDTQWLTRTAKAELSHEPPAHDPLRAHTLVGADGPELKPCAEVYLSDAAAETVLAQGIMLFLSHRNAVRLARFQSIADRPQALAGPWS
jgi:hypothetical protein